MKPLQAIILACLLMGCARESVPIENQFFGCTLGEATEAEVMAAMENYECLSHREGAMLYYGNVPFGGSVWESVMFMIEDDILRGAVFSDERSLPCAVQVERLNKQYPQYGEIDTAGDGYRYTDGKTQLEIGYSDLIPGTQLIYRDRSSKSWQEW
ncbi:MAG: hypothetical protein NC324_01725 [Bacteroides sp.]|nr:hypothetical protein [Bacteroides sp.]